MRIEKLSKGRKKKIVLTITILVLLIGIVYITYSRAKYHVTSNIQIVKGKVSYSLADFNLIAVKIQEKGSDGKGIPGSYKNGDVPVSGYKLQPLSNSNKNTTHCEVNGEVVSGISVEYRGGKVNFKGVTKQGTKCYLYFDVGTSGDPDATLEALHLSKTGDLPSAISTTACDNGTNDESHNKSGSNCTSQDKGIYETEDDFGKTYVFRGTIDNNWVRFADMYWRIIRINGNGTIRMIYSGIDKPSDGRWANQNGGKGAAITTSNSSDPTVQKYNNVASDNTYVGYMNGPVDAMNYGNAHQNEKDSTIKKEIDDWYIGSSGIKEQYRDKIDVETGFCNDRELSPKAHDNWGVAGYGKEKTAYAGYDRTHVSGTTSYDSTQEPTLKCANPTRDLFTGPNAQGTMDSEGNEINGNNKLTYPIGLITLDEAIAAGGLASKINYGCWISTGQYYWTMTPSLAPDATVATVDARSLGIYSVFFTWGVRPVINLKSDVTITGTGTIDFPYEIS